MASSSSPTASPFTVPATWPSAAVEEDPVVELATPALEVVVADEPADLREGRPEHRAVDRHATAPGRRALDDLDAVVLGGRAAARGRGRRRPRAGRASARAWPAASGAAPSRRSGVRVQARVAAPGLAVLAELAVGRDVRQPAEVAPGALAGEVDRAALAAVDRCRRDAARAAPSGRPRDGRRRAAARCRAPRSVGPNRERRVGRSRSRRLSSLAMAAPPNARAGDERQRRRDRRRRARSRRRRPRGAADQPARLPEAR